VQTRARAISHATAHALSNVATKENRKRQEKKPLEKRNRPPASRYVDAYASGEGVAHTPFWQNGHPRNVSSSGDLEPKWLTLVTPDKTLGDGVGRRGKNDVSGVLKFRPELPCEPWSSSEPVTNTKANSTNCQHWLGRP